MKIAIVGSGISGLAVAHALKGQAALSLFEAGDYFGGHTHTVDVTLPDASGRPGHPGRRYRLPGLQRAHLPAADRAVRASWASRTATSDMSFSVQVPGAGSGRALEWSGSNLDSRVRAARATCSTRASWACCRPAALQPAVHPHRRAGRCDAELMQPLGDFLCGPPLRRRPSATGTSCRCWAASGAARPSRCCSSRSRRMIRFCHNHGLLQVGQPAAVAHGDRRCAPLCREDPGRHRRQAAQHAGAR